MTTTLAPRTAMATAAICSLSLIFLVVPDVGAAPSKPVVVEASLIASSPSVPTPVLPAAYSCIWNLTEGADVAGLVVVSSGSTEIDPAGKGKGRELTVLKRKSDLFPGRTFHMEVEAISNYDSGDLWTRTCSNQTAVEVCNCVYTPLSGSIPPPQNPSDWSYVGETTVNGEACTQWQVSVNPPITWTISKATPNLLIQASLTEGTPVELTVQDFGKYVLAPPAPSRWVLPASWNCSK
jgi:hypothetical protein